MTFHPFLVARYGVYAAAAAAGISVWLGSNAGASLDYALLRAVFVFVIFVALAFAAEALLSTGWQEPQPVVVPSPPAEELAND